MCTKIMAQFNTANCFELTSGLFLLPLSVQGSIFQPHRRTSGGGLSGIWSPRQLHIAVRTGGIFYFPWHRHQIEGTNVFYCLIRKTLAKRGKRNCQSSEEKSVYRSGTQTIDRPVAGRFPNPRGHRPPPYLSANERLSCWSWSLTMSSVIVRGVFITCFTATIIVELPFWSP